MNTEKITILQLQQYSFNVCLTYNTLSLSTLQFYYYYLLVQALDR